MRPFFKGVINRWVVVVILLLVAAVAVQVGLLAFPGVFNEPEPLPLDTAQVEALRGKYPEMPREYDATVDITRFDLSAQVKYICQAYVLAEVVERLDDSSKSFSLSLTEGMDPALLAEKEKNLRFALPGINSEQVFENYRLRIVDIFYQGDGIEDLDPSLAVSVGQVIEARSCVFNSFLGGVFPLPDMQPDERLIIGLSIGKRDGLVPSGYQFESKDLYYVVDGTHVISATQELEPQIYSGLSLPAFKRIVQEIRNTHTEQDDRLREIKEGVT